MMFAFVSGALDSHEAVIRSLLLVFSHVWNCFQDV